MKTVLEAKRGASAPVASGLEGVVAAETLLSDVDGEGGRLIIAGTDVESLAGQVSFEELAFRLWRPYHADVRSETLAVRLGEARSWAFSRLASFAAALGQADGMDALRAGLAQLSEAPGTPGLESAIRLTATTAVLTGAWARTRAGHAPLPPDPSAPHAHDLLRMLGATAD